MRLGTAIDTNAPRAGRRSFPQRLDPAYPFRPPPHLSKAATVDVLFALGGAEIITGHYDLFLRLAK